MARKRRRVLRPGEDSYARTPSGETIGEWELLQTDDTSPELCAVCSMEVERIYCLSKIDEFEEKRTCYDCALRLVKDSKELTEVKEELEKVGPVSTSETRFDALWEDSHWQHTATPGNRCRTVGGIYIIVFRHQKGDRVGQWGFKVGLDWSTRNFSTCDLAKRAAYTKAMKYFRETQVQAAQNATTRRQQRPERPWENGTPYGPTRSDNEADALNEAIRRIFEPPDRDSEDLRP